MVCLCCTWDEEKQVTLFLSETSCEAELTIRLHVFARLTESWVYSVPLPVRMLPSEVLRLR
jgi:hypothetical protein